MRLLALLVCLAGVVALITAGCKGDGESTGAPSTTVASGNPASAAPVGSTQTSAPGSTPGSTLAPGTRGVCEDRSDQGPGDTNATLAHDGLDRTYILHIPPQYEGATPLPLVLNLHGFGSNARQQAVYSRLPAKADAEGFIVVTPDGAGTPQRWNNIGLPGEADDIGFISALLDDLERTLCIDPDRIYAAGISNGSAMSQRLACALDGRIAAVGAVAAFVYPLNCANDRPIPIVAFHGTADACVPYDGGMTACGRGNLPVPPVETSAANWARHDQCEAAPARASVSQHLQLIAYDTCASASAVHLNRVEGGGHTWPGSIDVPRLGPVTGEIDATDVIWQFFKAHPKPH